MKIEQLIKKHIKEIYEIKKSNNYYLSEQIPPAALRNVIKSVGQLSKTRITRQLQNLLSRRGNDIDGFIEGVTNKGTPFTRRIATGQEFFDNFIGGKVTERDAEFIFKEIFKAVDEPAVISDMADYLVKNNSDFVSKYKFKPKEQIIDELTPLYGKTQGEILTSKLLGRSISPTVRGIVKLLGEAFGTAWQSPKLYKIIWNLRGSINGVSSWDLFLRWLFTGTTRNLRKEVSEIYKSFIKKGLNVEQSMMLTRLLISLPMEVLQRWVILNGAVTAVKILSEYSKDNIYQTGEGERRSDKEVQDLAWKDLEDNWPNYKLAWVWPAGTIGRIMWQVAKGIWYRNPPRVIHNQIFHGELPEQQELNQLERQVQTSTFNPGEESSPFGDMQ